MAGPSRRLRPARVADLVADSIRARIINGQLADGEYLPKGEVLRAEFGVGKPAMREAMRILESEQLISVVRGNRGGARIRAPRTSNAAYALGLVLASHDVSAADVGAALSELEPTAAELCARRLARGECAELAAELERNYAACVATMGRGEPVDALLRQFHESLAASCGIQTISLVLGSLEALWSAHLSTSSSAAPRDGHGRSPAVVRASVDSHKDILDAVLAGDADAARAASASHAARLHRPLGDGLQKEIGVGTLQAVLALSARDH